MTALLIILGIIAFIFLLLICPLSFSAVYDGEFELKIKYLFLSFRIFPPKEKKFKKEKRQKKKSEKAKEPKEEKKKNPILDFVKQKGIGGLIEMLKTFAKIIAETVSSVTKHLVISKLDVNVLVVGDDAADTAMKYGYVCSAVYPLISIIDSNVKKCKHSENIIAGFNDPEMKILCSVKVRIKPLFLIITAVKTAFKGIKAIAKWQ